MSLLQQKVVLVAEDEAIIRMAATEALTNAGFSVIEAEHAAEALAFLQTVAEDVHALLTDIHMPGEMDGLELAHHAHGHWPWIALLVVSGRARQPAAHEMPPGCRFVPKPYDSDHIIDHLMALISRI